MNKKALLILLFLATPIFIRLTRFGENNIKTVVIILLFVLLFAIINKGVRPLNFNNPLLRFNIQFAIIIILQLFLTGVNDLSIRLFFRAILPLIDSILMIMYFSNYENNYKIQLIEKIFKWIGFIFIIQLVLSIYEMKSGSTLIHYGIINSIDTVQKNIEYYNSRSLLELFGIHFNFKFPMTMLLGQWNYSAPHLAVYNLIFLVSFYFKRSKYFLFLVILTFVATLLNTTRAAIISVLLTDILFMLFYFKGNKFVRNLLRFTLISIVIILFFQIFSLLEYYFSKTDTLTGRLDYYSTYLYYIANNITFDILGHGFIRVMQLGKKLRAMAGYGGGSFESQFFETFFTYGIFGLYFFVNFLKNTYFYKLNIPKINSIFFKLLALSIVLTSLTLGGIFFIYTYPFMTLLYIYLLDKDKIMINDRKIIESL